MKAFAGLLFILIIFGVAFLMARYSQRERLPRNDRKELIAARNLIDELSISASEHLPLGDSYAPIVLDEIRKYKKGIQ